MTTVEILKEMAFTATETQRRALEDAISVLSAEGDLISRQTAIDAFERFIHELGIKDEPYNYGEMALSTQNVPSVENKGEWIKDEKMSIVFDIYRCSRCSAGGEPRYKFCPNCGADMRGEPDAKR